MKFDRLMDFTTYALMIIIALSLIWAAISMLFDIRDLEKELENFEGMECYCCKE